MVKKFLNGLLFGGGFAIAFIIIIVIFFNLFFASTFNSSSESNESVTSVVPLVPKAREGYLGSIATYSGGFKNNKSEVLSSGPGEIKAVVKGNGQPVKDLKLRLALNGEIMSQWGTSNRNGIYSISVPYGQYKIDGFELDSQSANKTLAGLISSPLNPHSTGSFNVSENESGTGIDFIFVKPVIKNTKGETFSLNEPVVISWQPYDDASSYQIQVFGKLSPHDYRGNNTLFSWSTRPELKETSIDLKSYASELKPGYFYTYEVSALDENGNQISETERSENGYDFKVK